MSLEDCDIILFSHLCYLPIPSFMLSIGAVVDAFSTTSVGPAITRKASLLPCLRWDEVDGDAAPLHG